MKVSEFLLECLGGIGIFVFAYLVLMMGYALQAPPGV
jgi:hypothetical protein